MLADLQQLVRERTTFVRTVPLHGLDDKGQSDWHAAQGAQQWQERIQAIFSADTEALDLTEATLAFTSALAHFAVADGRQWEAR